MAEGVAFKGCDLFLKASVIVLDDLVLAPTNLISQIRNPPQEMPDQDIRTIVLGRGFLGAVGPVRPDCLACV